MKTFIKELCNTMENVQIFPASFSHLELLLVMLHKVLTLFENSYNYTFLTLYLANDFVSKRVLVIFNLSFLIFNKSHETFGACNEYSENAYGSDQTDY